MHLISPDAGMMGTSAVVGTTIPNAVGYAYAMKYQRKGAIVASFFGDGATEEGVFAESLNLAALKRVPILFVCENNGYAIHTHQSRRQATPAICDRVKAHGVPAERLEDNDVLYLHRRAHQAAERVRSGAGPYFLEVMTYRWREHVGPGEDYHLGFRSHDEAKPWIENDQLLRLERMTDAAVVARIQQEVRAEIADAFAFAEASPWPRFHELCTNVTEE
jgi:TPP-dependent pyruvate/acetoin dehydrogenase alpha subunit